MVSRFNKSFDPESLNLSIKRGLAYLFGYIDTKGIWQTFESSQGQSDVWVPAYILHQLSSLGSADERLSRLAQVLFKSQSDTGAWGYKRNFIPDSDSTATVLLALYRYDPTLLSSDITNSAIDFLIGHLQDWESGFGTYTFKNLSKVFTTKGEEDLRGWLNPHMDVSLNVCNAISTIGANTYYPQCKQLYRAAYTTIKKDEVWEAYWWSTDLVCTYLLLELAQTLGERAHERTAFSRLEHIASQARKDGYLTSNFSKSPCMFTTALGLQCFASSLKTYHSEMNILTQTIIQNQNKDGSWNSTPILAIPSPRTLKRADEQGWRIDQPGYPNILSDNERVLVTAKVVNSLYSVFKEFRKPFKSANLGGKDENYIHQQ